MQGARRHVGEDVEGQEPSDVAGEGVESVWRESGRSASLESAFTNFLTSLSCQEPPYYTSLLLATCPRELEAWVHTKTCPRCSWPRCSRWPQPGTAQRPPSGERTDERQHLCTTEYYSAGHYRSKVPTGAARRTLRNTTPSGTVRHKRSHPLYFRSRQMPRTRTSAEAESGQRFLGWGEAGGRLGTLRTASSCVPVAARLYKCTKIIELCSLSR